MRPEDAEAMNADFARRQLTTLSDLERATEAVLETGDETLARMTDHALDVFLQSLSATTTTTEELEAVGIRRRLSVEGERFCVDTMGRSWKWAPTTNAWRRLGMY